MCNKQLAPGDEFALRADTIDNGGGGSGGGGLLCKLDNEMFEKQQLITSSSQSTANTTCQNITNLQPMVNPNGLSSSSNIGMMNGVMNSKMGVKMAASSSSSLGLDDSQVNEFEGTNDLYR